MTYTQTSLATLRSKAGSLLQKIYTEFGLVKTELDALAAVDAAVDAELTKVANSNLSATHKITRSATIVIAASDSSAKSKAQADYVCDGTDDHVEINAAIASISTTGGKIQLLEGTYNLSDSVLLSSNITFEGMGKATVLTGVNRPIEIVDVEYSIITDISLDGNSLFAEGIHINGGYSLNIKNCYIYNFTTYGIYFEKGSASPYKGSFITSNFIYNVGDYLTDITGYGIYLKSLSSDYSEYIKIIGNNISLCGTAIRIEGNNNTVTGNVLDTNHCGISIKSAARAQIIGNTINHSTSYGLFLNTGSSLATVADNFIVHSGQEGISIYENPGYHLITSNHIYSNGDLNSGDDHDTEIRINCSTNIKTIFINNHIGVDSDPNANACVSITNPAVSGIHFLNNFMENQSGAGHYFSGWSSANGVIRDNYGGYSVENTGTATITTGQTSVNVTHGLAAAPTRVQLTPTTATAGNQFYVSAKTNSTFTITIDSEATEDISFDWQATL